MHSQKPTGECWLRRPSASPCVRQAQDFGASAVVANRRIVGTVAFLVAALAIVLTLSAPPARAQVGNDSAVAKPDANHRIVDGMDIYFGGAPAEAIRKEHPGSDPESAMHGGIPQGGDFYHLNISIFDAASKTAIRDARVEVKIMDAAKDEQSKILEPMEVNGAVSYGNYVRLSGSGRHLIVVSIRKAGADRATETRFEFQR